MESNHKEVRSALLVSLLCLTMFMTACKEEAKTECSWRDREICVDGKDREWEGCPQYYDEDSRTLINLLHDEKFLFVRLSWNKQSIQRKILVEGFTLWLEQKGEDKRKIGVHFPVGLPRESRPTPFGGPLLDKQDPLKALVKKAQGEIQLLGPNEYEQITMPLEKIEKYNIDVNINKTQKNLVYELKIPITRTEDIRYALLYPGKEGFRLGFQAGDKEDGTSGFMGNQTPRGVHSPEGRRGKSGRMRGGMRGESTGAKGGKSGSKKVEPLELWLDVTLTKKDQSGRGNNE